MLILKQIRESKGLTQQRLADKINISRSTIAMYETGKSEPDLKTLKFLANTLNVSIDCLLGNETEISEIIQIMPGAEENLSDNKKQLIEMIKELNEDDTLIAMGVIARLNNKPVEEIFRKIT